MSPSEMLGIAALPERDMRFLSQGCHPDPFAVLGPHFVDGLGFVRAYMPEAVGIIITSRKKERTIEMTGDGKGIFAAVWDYSEPYRFDINWPKGIQQAVDPYAFGVQLTDDDLHLFSEGRHFDLATRFGANVREIDGVRGVLFAVWAPNAMSVAVVGDFNSWDPRRHPMRLRHGHGVWELFVPDTRVGHETNTVAVLAAIQAEREAIAACLKSRRCVDERS